MNKDIGFATGVICSTVWAASGMANSAVWSSVWFAYAIVASLFGDVRIGIGRGRS